MVSVCRKIHKRKLSGTPQARLPRFLVFEQSRRQVAEFSVVLDDQCGSTFLLPLPHD
jgi:hypothetical protein